MEDIISERRASFSLPPEAAERFTNSCAGWLLQAKIAGHFAEDGVQLFNVTSKCLFFSTWVL